MAEMRSGEAEVSIATLDEAGQPYNWRSLGKVSVSFKADMVNPALMHLLLGPPPEPPKITALVHEETYEGGVSLVTKKVTYPDGRLEYTGTIVCPGTQVYDSPHGGGLFSYDVLCTASWDGLMSVALIEWPDRRIHVAVHDRRITGPRGFADLLAEIHFGTNLGDQQPGWAHG